MPVTLEHRTGIFTTGVVDSMFRYVQPHSSPRSMRRVGSMGTLAALLTWLLVAAMTAEAQPARAGDAGSHETVDFRDDFTGTSLRPEWQLVNEDADRWTFFEDDYLLFITTTTAQGRRNTLRYKEDLPTNYAIVLKVVDPPSSDDQDVMIDLWRDEKNGIVLWWHGDGSIGFDKHLRGERNRIKANTGRISRDTALYLRFKKQGIHYSASWSLDGSSWSSVGTHLFLNLNGRKPTFSTANYRYSPPEVGVRFDFVEIKRLR